MERSNRASFGHRIKRYRLAAGLTQEELAERSELSSRGLAYIEHGARLPHRSTIRRLAAALGLSSAEVRELEASMSPVELGAEVPAAVSRLIGREPEVDGAVRLLAERRARLLTLTGPGGVGKTRIAIAIANDLRDAFPDGVSFVPLASLRDPRLVLPAIADRLGVSQAGSRSLPVLLQHFLAHRQVLLVLDNLEHVLPVTVELMSLLGGAAGLVVLATSRIRLRVLGEHIMEVAPLPMSAAVELFRERAAQAAAPIVNDQIDVVSDICRRLDRLPLAIELAASQTRTLTPLALQSRLHQALTVLKGGPRDAAERQQTLSHTISWSYDLLTGMERKLFPRLGVFAGRWNLEAATVVGEIDEWSAIEAHTALLDASLIGREPSVDEPRYALLETIRTYAEQRLEATGDSQLVRDLHADYYRDVTRSAPAGLVGTGMSRWMERLYLDHDNIRIALGRKLDLTRIDDFADMCFFLFPHWLIRGHVQEGELWTDSGLALADVSNHSVRAKLLYTSAVVVHSRGDYPAAATKFADAARLARYVEDWRTLSWAVLMTGYVALFQGRLRHASDYLRLAEMHSRRHGEPLAAAYAATGTAVTIMALGDVTRARDLLVAAEREVRDLDVPWAVALVLMFRSQAEMAMGNDAIAERALKDAVVILDSWRDVWLMMHTLTYLADVASIRSEPERSARLYGAADGLADRTGGSLIPLWRSRSDLCRDQVLTRLGQAAFDEYRREGQRRGLDGIVAIAVDPDP